MFTRIFSGIVSGKVTDTARQRYLAIIERLRQQGCRGSRAGVYRDSAVGAPG